MYCCEIGTGTTRLAHRLVAMSIFIARLRWAVVGVDNKTNQNEQKVRCLLTFPGM